VERVAPVRDGRHDESHQAVDDRACEELAERAIVTSVGSPEGLEIASAFSLSDDRWRVAQSDEQQVRQQAASSTVAIKERVYPLEARVDGGQRFR
jgi:hypothetical protein